MIVRGRQLGIWLILGTLYCRSALAAPDVNCIVERYNAYIELHNEAFLSAASELEQRVPDHYELLSDFIDYQILGNTLKAHVVSFLGARAPRQLLLGETLAKIAPNHSVGAVHRIMMADAIYRNSFPEWSSQTERFLQKSSYSEKEWSEFVEARNVLNRLLATTSHYPDVISAYRTPVAELCRIR